MLESMQESLPIDVLVVRSRSSLALASGGR